MRSFIARYFKNNDWLNPNVIATVLIVKFLILFFAAHSYQALADKPIGDWHSYLKLWSRWDAESYLSIAENGYATEGKQRFLLVFFPLYPLLTTLVAVVFKDYILSAFIVSGAASIAAGLFFRLLVKLDHPEKTAQHAVFFLFIFPTAYFLHIPYTESLFIALVVGCFWAARTEKWLAAGILGFLACLTRVNGIILFAALLFEMREQYRLAHAINRRWSATLLVPLGFFSYLALNYAVAGNALMFLTYQRENWSKYLRFPFQGLWEKYQTFLHQPAANSNIVGFQELFFVAVGLAAIVFGWKHMRNSYRVWMIANWLLFISTSFVLSVPRYTLTMFPIFILMALLARLDQRLNVLLTIWSLLYLALFSSLFVKGNWAF